MYSNIRSRAGLVALVFALIISLVSAVPIPIRSGHSSALSQWDLIHSDTSRLARIPLNSPISTVSATTGAPTGGSALVDSDNQLVPRNLGDKIKAAFQKVGHAIAHVAQKIGSGIKSVAQKIGSGIKKVAQKVGSGIKTAAKKVGHFVKTTGAKIVKFGLKVVSTVQQAAAKVAGFIPGVGKFIGKALEAESKVTGFISDKIHANLGSKLEKGMSVMNKAHKVMGYIPRRRDLSELEEEDFY